MALLRGVGLGVDQMVHVIDDRLGRAKELERTVETRHAI